MQAYSSYNSTRQPLGADVLCRAPFNNMYFNVHGHVGPCWLTLQPDESIGRKTIKEIWTGQWFTNIRKAIREENLGSYCSTCKKNIETGNHVSVLAKLYDLNYELSDYPVAMEFELSNICNLECVMCKGELSSAIREKRENLPRLSTPYTDEFSEQLKEFLPHLKEAKFLGGEPFLIPVYYSIWDNIIKINPHIKITITTNGTVWNTRVKQILESLHVNIIMSIDSFNAQTYDSIRIGGNFSRVIENFEHFRNYCVSKNTYMGISINPLRKNWQELTAHVNFCNEKNVPLWFNTIVYPHREALWTMRAVDLKEIYEALAQQKPEEWSGAGSKSVYENNLKNYQNLVEVQIKNWWNDALKRERERANAIEQMNEEQIQVGLRSNIERSVLQDAYLSPTEREKTITSINKCLDEAKTKLSLRQWEELYTMPETEAILQIEGSLSLTSNI